MTAAELHALRFPVGEFSYPEDIESQNRAEWIETIRNFPNRISSLARQLSKQQLDTPYRPEGWTAKQVIHHCGDSHLNCLIRFRLGLTEDHPTIKPYLEDRWANLPDYGQDIEVSLGLLMAVHARLSFMLDQMTDSDFSRTIYHPEQERSIRLDELLSLYAWHCDHHYAHVALVKGS